MNNHELLKSLYNPNAKKCIVVQVGKVWVLKTWDRRPAVK